VNHLPALKVQKLEQQLWSPKPERCVPEDAGQRWKPATAAADCGDVTPSKKNAYISSGMNYAIKRGTAAIEIQRRNTRFVADLVSWIGGPGTTGMSAWASEPSRRCRRGHSREYD
jgi:hypothetical protein